MKKLFIALLFVFVSLGASAQDIASGRMEIGFNFGEAGSFSEYARLGVGGNVVLNGIYLDFLIAEPEHKYYHYVTDTQWNDTCAFCINAGFQIPILSWLRIMPLVGYSQTNEGITDGTSINFDSGDGSTTWYHDYTVTPGTRTHRLNYGGGISVQPCKWFSVNLIATRNALYGGIGLDVFSLTKVR